MDLRLRFSFVSVAASWSLLSPASISFDTTAEPILASSCSDAERQWTGPFCFIQAADPQLGLMKAWRDGDCDSGGEEWAEEVELTKQAVEAVNQLRPRPRFMVLCGDLVHAMPGRECAQKGHVHHFKNLLLLPLSQ